jgi:hypothetical protein
MTREEAPAAADLVYSRVMFITILPTTGTNKMASVWVNGVASCREAGSDSKWLKNV